VPTFRRAWYLSGPAGLYASTFRPCSRTDGPYGVIDVIWRGPSALPRSCRAMRRDDLFKDRGLHHAYLVSSKAEHGSRPTWNLLWVHATGRPEVMKKGLAASAPQRHELTAQQ